VPIASQTKLKKKVIVIKCNYNSSANISTRSIQNPLLLVTKLRTRDTPIQWVPGVKRPGREADHSPPASADVKKMLISTYIPPYAFMAYSLIT
jgi:hypothetical protein